MTAKARKSTERWECGGVNEIVDIHVERYQARGGLDHPAQSCDSSITLPCKVQNCMWHNTIKGGTVNYLKNKVG